jgi:DNA-binding transcriptional ArsR family regulator
VTETFSALAEPSRLRIVELLRDGPRSVTGIGEALRLNQPQVSKHLRVLRAARLVDVEPRAQQRLYALRPEPLRELAVWLERYRRVWDERLDQLDEVIRDLQTPKTKKDGTHGRRKKR